MQYKTVSLNALTLGIMPKVSCVQDDTARAIKCYTDLDMRTITHARIYIKKPDGTEVFSECEIEDGYVIAPLTSQTLAVTGNAVAQLFLTDDGEFVTTYKFIIEVLKSYISDGSIESSNEYTALESLIAEAETFEERIENNTEDIFKNSEDINTLMNASVSGAVPVSSMAAMTDTNKIYLLKTDGKIYYHNGTQWVEFQQFLRGPVKWSDLGVII